MESGQGKNFGSRKSNHLRGRKDGSVLFGNRRFSSPEEAMQAWKANRMGLQPDVLKYLLTVEMLFIWQRDTRANDGKVCILVIDQRGSCDLEDLLLDAPVARRKRK